VKTTESKEPHRTGQKKTTWLLSSEEHQVAIRSAHKHGPHQQAADREAQEVVVCVGILPLSDSVIRCNH
jgi:hypothetical protein